MTRIVFLMVLLCLVIAAGCGGSSASTSHEEVLAVASAERELSAAYRLANVQSRVRCEAKTTSDASFSRCFGATVIPRERAAEERFALAINEILAAGVGNGCAQALETAVAESSQVPLFRGEATEACRAESGRE
jgi:hypothetical protein